MIDFHTHILPEVDDGSSSIEETSEMLEMMKQQGVTAVVATPHFDMRKETADSFLDRRKKAVDAITGLENDIKIVTGAEVFYCGVPLHNIDRLEEACIGNSRYMLIETYLFELKEQFKDELLNLMRVRNIVPVLAHIERYTSGEKDISIIRELKSKGVLLQMNGGCFLRRSSRKSALRMLERESVDLLGSDCHSSSVRPPNIGKAAAVIEEHLGSHVVERINKNAQRILGMEE